MAAQRVYCLNTHTIKSDRLLKRLRVELTTGVKYAHRLDELSLRNASTIVANRYTQIILYVYLDSIAGLHLELVDRVIKHFF